MEKKLVRDRIPELIRAEGRTPLVRTLGPKEIIPALREKLVEEVDEYLSDARVEELVDIIEVVYALATWFGVDSAGLERRRAAKHVARGGFDKGVFLEGIQETPSDW